MTPSAGPRAELERLSRREATGEFICAAGPEEIHVYLQKGRVAWATSSAHPLEFTRYLKEQGKIDDETLRDVLSECRLQKLPLGETLVAWGFVGWDDVMAALRHQISLSFEQLAELADAQTMFLERRRFIEYNPELTLELASLFPEKGASPAPPGSAGARASAPLPFVAQPSGTGRSRQVLEALRGAMWVELLDGTHLREAAPPSMGTPRIPAHLIESTLEDAADFVAIRSTRGAIVGTRMPGEQGSMWCALGKEANYGIVLSTLRWLNLLPGDGRDPGRAPPVRPDEPRWSIGDLQSGSGAELRLVLNGGQGILAAIVLDRDRQPRAGIARAVIERTGCLALLARRAAMFAAPDPISPDGLAAPDLKELGVSNRMAVTGERGFWCFGADLGGGETLWVLIDRSALQGIGWACLTTLIRSVDRGEPLDEAAAT